MHQNPLVVQWLGLHASIAGATGWIPGRRTKIPYAAWCGQKKSGRSCRRGMTLPGGECRRGFEEEAQETSTFKCQEEKPVRRVRSCAANQYWW